MNAAGAANEILRTRCPTCEDEGDRVEDSSERIGHRRESNDV